MLKILFSLLFITIFTVANADEVKTSIKGVEIVATKLTKKIAFEMVKNTPTKSKFETNEDFLKRYQTEIPNNWFYFDYNIENAEYNINKKRFEWEYSPLVQVDFTTPLGKFEGQNSYGAKANIDSNLYEVINLSLERNIIKKESDLDKKMEEIMGVESYASSKSKSVENYLLTKGFETSEPVVFEISPQLAEKIKSIRILFKVNTLTFTPFIKEATIKEPIQLIAQVATLGISKSSVLRIDKNDYRFVESEIDTKYLEMKGFKIEQ